MKKLRIGDVVWVKSEGEFGVVEAVLKDDEYGVRVGYKGITIGVFTYGRSELRKAEVVIAEGDAVIFLKDMKKFCYSDKGEKKDESV